MLTMGPAAARQGSSATDRAIPAGATLELLLQSALDSGKAKVDDRFEATVIRPVEVSRQALVSVGDVARGYVGSVRRAGGNAQPYVTLAFDELTRAGRGARMRATVIGVFDAKPSRDASRPEIGPVTGAPGDLTPLIGVFVNPAGAIVGREAADVKLPVGVILRIRLDQPVVFGGG
jgi:hypothetical protein